MCWRRFGFSLCVRERLPAPLVWEADSVQSIRSAFGGLPSLCDSFVGVSTSDAADLVDTGEVEADAHSLQHVASSPFLARLCFFVFFSYASCAPTIEPQIRSKAQNFGRGGGGLAAPKITVLLRGDPIPPWQFSGVSRLH